MAFAPAARRGMGSIAVSTNHPRKHGKTTVSRLRKPPGMLLEAWQIALAGLLGRDQATGRQYLKLPLPEGEAAQGVLALLQGLLAPPR